MDLARVEVEWTNGVAVARVRGEIDLANAEDLLSGLTTPAEEAPLVVVDLSQLEFIGSAGLHALFRVGRLCSESGGRMCLVVPEGSPVESTLLVADLPETVSVYGSVAAAIEQNA